MAVRRITNQPDTDELRNLLRDELRDLLRDELRDLLMVVRRALLMIDAWWQNYPREQFPPSHPYRLALRMVVGYIERRYTDR